MMVYYLEFIDDLLVNACLMTFALLEFIAVLICIFKK